MFLVVNWFCYLPCRVVSLIHGTSYRPSNVALFTLLSGLSWKQFLYS